MTCAKSFSAPYFPEKFMYFLKRLRNMGLSFTWIYFEGIDKDQADISFLARTGLLPLLRPNRSLQK